ncbi:MAG: RNA pseudouridine synthase [Thiotrichales bacterium]|nr:RNA pseudouridine synthase [Thiotrichales bacterium]
MSQANNPSDTQHFQVIAEQEANALDLLADASPFSKAQLKDFAQKGAVWLSHGDKRAESIRRLKRTLKIGQQIDLYYNPKLLALPLLDNHLQAQLIADFGSYSVWFKPRGMLSQGSKFGDFQSLPRWIELRSESVFGTPRQCWQIHRLDRATEGLMLIAHTKKTAAQLTRLFEIKQIHKTYLANVWGEPEQATWSSYQPIDDKPATSHFKVLGSDEIGGHAFSRVEIQIETGRKHQIRKHLSQANLPIIGDRMYGDPELNPQYDFDLQLSAYRLQWRCPQDNIERCIQLAPSDLTLLPVTT